MEILIFGDLDRTAQGLYPNTLKYLTMLLFSLMLNTMKDLGI